MTFLTETFSIVAYLSLFFASLYAFFFFKIDKTLKAKLVRFLKGFYGTLIFIPFAFFICLILFTPPFSNGPVPRTETAIFREVAGMIAGSYQTVLMEKGLYEVTLHEKDNVAEQISNLSTNDLLPFWNYVSEDHDSIFYVYDKALKIDCNTEKYDCLLLHNGGILAFENEQKFGGNTKNHALLFYLWPTEIVQGMVIILYANGQLTDGEISFQKKHLFEGKRKTIVNGEPIKPFESPDYINW